MKNKKLLKQCLIASLGLHATALWIFYTQPVFLRPYLTMTPGKSSTDIVIPVEEEDINLSEKNIALEEIFNQIVVLSPHLHKPYDLEYVVPWEVTGKPTFEPIRNFSIQEPVANFFTDNRIPEPVVISTPALTLPTDIFLPALNVSDTVSPILPPLPYERTPHLEYIRELQSLTASTTFEIENHTLKLDIHYPASLEALSVKPALSNINLKPSFASSDTSEFIALVPPEKLQIALPAFSYEPIASNFITTPTALQGPKISQPSSLPPLSAYGFPQSRNIVQWNDDFNVDIRTFQKEEGGYLFSIALSPKYDLTNQRMKQNYYFLIDRSNSIEKHRYQTFKRAVSKALISLHQGDAFNIIVFDSKISKLSEKPLPYSKKSIQLAEDFLEKQSHGTYFAATDIYSSLNKIMPSDVAEDELNTAILISDGDSPLHPEKQRKLIQTWLEKNNGKVSLYTACVGEGNNKTMLDLLSSMSRGSMLHTETHTSFPRKLAKMVIDLRYPIAKDLAMTITKADPSSKLKLYPASAYLPALFSNHPYVIFGTAEKLSDFTLLLEGRNKNQILSITKSISFNQSKEDGRFLSQKWKTSQAHQYYEEYMEEGQIATLQKAESLFKIDKPKRTRR